MKQKMKQLSVLYVILMFGLILVLTATAQADEHDHSSWTSVTSVDNLPTANGNYNLRLDSDLTLTNCWTVPVGTTNLCLNGHGLNGGGSNTILRIPSGSTLNLYDCNTTTTHNYRIESFLAILDENGENSFTGGYITGGHGGLDESNSLFAGGVFIEQGTLNMYGGTIIGNAMDTPNGGAGVYLYGGTFNMHDGLITGNRAYRTTGSTGSPCGGGVLVKDRGSSTAYFNMYGGEIKGNFAEGTGGGVFLAMGEFTMSGGSITENICVYKGGGVYVNENQYAVFKLSGAPTIIGNITSSNEPNNIFLGKTNSYTSKIQIIGNLSLPANVNTPAIGIGIASGAGVFTSSTDTAYNDASKFFSDNNDEKNFLVGKNQSGQLLLGDPKTVTYQPNGGTGEMSSNTYAAGSYISTPANGFTAPSNCTFIGWKDGGGKFYHAGDSFTIRSDTTLTAQWFESHTHNELSFQPWTSTTSLPTSGNWALTQDVTVSSTTTISSSNTLNLCLNGHGILKTGNGRVFTVNGSSSTLNLYDCGTQEHYITLESWRGTAVSDSDTATNVTNGSGTVKVIGGYITGGYTDITSEHGGCIACKSGGKLNMHGGTIIGNKTSDELVGGGVFADKDSAASFDGGTICYCYGVLGGGVMAYGNLTVAGNAAIVKNTCRNGNGGGGIFSNNDYSKCIILSGSPSIQDNKSLDATDKRASDDDNITMYNYSTGGRIQIQGSFTPVGKIGIGLANGNHNNQAGVFTKSTDTTLNNVNYFTNDEVGYAVIKNTDGQLELVPTYTVTYDANGGTGDPLTDTSGPYISSSSVTVLDNTFTAPTGFTFAGWNTAADGSGTTYVPGESSSSKTFTISDNTTLYAQWVHRHTANGQTIDFKPWTSDNSLPTNGNYCLIADVTVSDKTTVSGNTVTLNLCLNGKTITYSGSNNPVFYISGGTLNLYDESENNGSITGGKGCRTEGSGTQGGAVYISSGTFNMYGGKLTGNSVDNSGGAVFVNKNCNFNMYGGIITGNSAMHGGGICVEGKSQYDSVAVNGTAVIYGGTISNNTASDGGGIRDDGIVTICGGSITGNSIVSNSTLYGGGVYVGFNSTTELNLYGNPNISGNTKNDAADNIYLNSGKKINITDTLSNTTPIGVRMYAPGVFTDGLNERGSINLFKSDDTMLSVGSTELNEAKLVLPTVYYKDSTGAVVSINDYTIVGSSSFYGSGTYVALDSVSSSYSDSVNSLNLILLDGVTLSRKRIEVSSSKTLNIFAGSLTETINGTGKLIVTENSDGYAGIGSDKWNSCGTVNVYGGTVIATGGNNSVGIGSAPGTDSKNGTLTLGSGLYLYGGDSADPTTYIPSDANGKYARYRYMIINNVVPHIHKASNGEDINFKAWERTDSLPTTSGNYYLTDNVTLSSQWSAPEGTTNLCLNGKSITSNASTALLAGSNSVLNIYDHNETNTGTITCATGYGIRAAESGKVNFYGGTITGCKTGIRVEDSSSTAKMFAGLITANVDNGVETVKGTFILHNGSITNNTKRGVYVGWGSTFKLDGTESAPMISGNGFGILLEGEGTTIGVENGTSLDGSARIPVRMVDKMNNVITGTFITGLTVPNGVFTCENGDGYEVHIIDNSAEMRLIPATAPTINTQPQNLNLEYGYSEGGLSVVATVAQDTTYADLTYQWYKCDDDQKTNPQAIEATTESTAATATYTIPTGKAIGTTEYYYCVVTATRTDNGKTATATSDVATVTVNKANPFTTEPTGKTVYYNGQEQSLVTAGTLKDQSVTVLYAIGVNAETAPADDEAGIAEDAKKWKTEIPKAKAVGTYYVWIKSNVMKLTKNM